MDPERIRCAMVLFAIEQDMADFVRRFAVEPSQIPAGIYKKVKARAELPEISVEEFIERSYIEELLSCITGFDKSIVGGLAEYAERIRDVIECMNVFDIRNVVAHPNRQYIACYWHRLGALATDPAIDGLKFVKTQKAFFSAEQGTLDHVPEEWLDSLISMTPNNLPPSFEHSITGLIGRQKEEKALQSILSNPRNPLVAVVGPGGVGKTALSLAVLSRAVRQPDAKQMAEGVLFASMKLEKLTLHGIEAIDGLATFEALEHALTDAAMDVFNLDCENFADVKTALANQRVLLCIDNAETVLRDRAVEFDHWNQQLPPAWRVLVTSRVTVNSAYCLPISDLQENQAETLAKVYAARKGMSFGNDALASLVASCMCNPLAIRLALDLYQTGKQLPEAIGISKQNIASFSYNNLIETLSQSAVEVLECLFLGGELDRADIGCLIERNLDETAQAVGELLRTSLLGRRQSDEKETYLINESVRDLLTINPRNLQARERIIGTIKKNRDLSRQIVSDQQERGVDQFAWNFIPQDIPQGLKSILHKMLRSTLSRNPDKSRVAAFYEQLRANEPQYKKHACFNIFFAWTLSCLRSGDQAAKLYLRAIELAPRNIAYAHELGRFYNGERRYDEAMKIFSDLKERGFFDPTKTNAALSGKIASGYFLSHLFSGNFSVVLEVTKEWKTDPWRRGLLGVFRAGALKRQAENGATPLLDRLEILRRSTVILDDVFGSEGYLGMGLTVSKNLIEEIGVLLEVGSNICPEHLLGELLGFCDRHVGPIYAEHKDGPASLPKLIEALAHIETENNPFRTVKWLSQVRQGNEPRRLPEGTLHVKVINVPRVNNGFPRYLFAEAEDGQRVHIHFQNLRDGGWEDWCRLGVGDALGVVCSDIPPMENRCPSAAAIYFGEAISDEDTPTVR